MSRLRHLASPALMFLTVVALMVSLLMVNSETVSATTDGTVLAHNAPDNICDRPQAVQDAILAALDRTHLSCEQVEFHSSLLPSITELTIRGTQLTTLPSGSFYGLTGLERLEISSCGLDELPEDIFDGLSSLELLKLSSNDLEELPEDIFDGLDNLETLYLNQNELTALHQDVFDGLSSLEKLSLGGNELTALRADVFEDLDSLEELYLGFNELGTLPVNVFEDIADTLDTLDVGYNDLALGGLPSDFFASFTNLTFLNLEAIGKDLEGDTEGTMTSLAYDWFDDLSNLERLFLSNNELSSLPGDTFDGFSNLELLLLGNNDLTELPADLLEDLTNLEELELNGNQLAALPDGLFKGLSNLYHVNLVSNPGTPFTFTAELEKSSNNGVVIKVAEGAPFSMSVTLSAEGGTLLETSLTIPAGIVQSEVITVTHSGSDAATISVASAAFTSGSNKGTRAGTGGSLTLPANNQATGAPTISGTAQVGQTLTADVSDIADADGLADVSYSYQWLSSRDTEIDGATSSTYSVQSTDNGKVIKVRLTFTDDAGNDESLTSAGTAAVAAAPPPPLTVSLENTPSSHDGENAFTFDVRFSEELRVSYRTLRDHAFTVTGGTVQKAGRLEQGSNMGWRITVSPNSNEEVNVVLPATGDCDDDGAICTEDGRKLSGRLELTASGPESQQQPAQNTPATGAPTISGTVQVGEMLTADASGVADEDGLSNVAYSYQWVSNDGNADTDISGATASTYTLADADESKVISVKVSFTDDAGNAETLTSAATDAVEAKPNSPATGQPAISGTAQVGETLSADTAGIADEDGLTNASFAYQWQADGADISGATDSTYTLVDADEGKAVSVKVSFTDDTGNEEASTSAATDAVEAKPNSPATGAPTITGTAQAGETLTADLSGIADEDGLDNAVFSYQWLTDGADISGATVETYTLADADEGKAVSVKVSFTDDAGNAETLTSAATAAVEAKANSPATGAPTITGKAQVGETLTADVSGISDDDGLTNAVFSYQWLADDSNISGATGETYTVAGADEGKAIVVKVSFTDDRGHGEELSSAATAAVKAKANSPATGAPAITGTALVGETLTADTSGIADADGLDNVSFSYQWLADGAEISGATGSTYTLADADEGKAISVKVSFTDDAGNAETLTSAATAVVEAKPNSPAMGQPSITGAALVGETLTADTADIADEDGLDNVSYSYQWISSDGGTDSEIGGATDSTYTLASGDVGRTIKVRVSFSDDRGNGEELTSAATDAVAGLPLPPLTASLENVATSHDGASVFTFELRFSEEFGISYKTLRDRAFTVTGGTVKKAQRLEQGSNIGWRITVRPDGNGQVVVVLPETTDCDAQGAICTEDGRKLSHRLELTVGGPGQ